MSFMTNLGRQVTRVVRVLAVAAVGVAAYLILRRLDFAALRAALAQARPALLLLAIGCNAGNFLFRAVMWRIMLHEERPLPIGRLVRYTVAAFAASALTPARAGEVLRLWLLRRHHQISYARSAGAALAEKLLDGLALVVLVAPLPWLALPLPAWTGRAVFGLAIGGVTLLAGAVLITRYMRPGRRLGSFLGQISILREPVTLVKALGAALGAGVFDLGTLWFTLEAFHISHGFGGAAFVLLVTNAALVIPSTPGNIGALEAGAVVALDVLGVPRPQGVAFALVYHALQLGPLLLFAALNLRLILGAGALQAPENQAGEPFDPRAGGEAPTPAE
jgi:uncharacterized membrane protein YbhN (UPF0104 family)